ncbi:tripartite motif-containing protein 66 [Austrofundulus limnaeus]|uniref:Tripartite motif-containing protein 66-like n=1 Tax=Austrofundulus limnaeus TaxID=52670 RepID=A0A2I4CQ60_AUSLI|nr:PREDICTED: tripartite motif-containing protein 66-like [Austrofundulus limnaeus]XP_013882118.1 PREDICTED: tripartite motif-containing protein 66-like [Austrofundulus limnaeus]XP_013882124.1 PREDICTED: tripartite motif-containing protein 66-like [Austrofundulus limnaeus]
MEKICSECTEPTLAQSLCTLCNKWLCYQCTDVHQHQRPPAASQYSDSYQQPRPGATQCPDVHQRNSGPLPPAGQGLRSYPCPLLMCHSHRQEPLELFCESCDLLCCSSCHLSSHKNHRVEQIGKALQDQQWLFENLMVQVEERRSLVENSAKQIEDRLHGVKIAHRKAENQIKMAKMIMMNELNKRANLLIEQLEKISEDFQQRLEDQLQGAIEICGQLDHLQKFITWATTHHCRGPVLFSRALISLQMQQLLEASLHPDSWNPLKIKFNWDASYWTKQISSLGQLTVEGGNCAYPPGLACSSIMRPQPISCLALPSLFHRGRDPGCGYQTCCEPQMCCLHGVPPQSDLSSLDKNQMEATLFSSGCSQPALISAPVHQSQQLQRFWDTESSLQCPPPPASSLPGPVQVNCSQGSASQPQTDDTLPHPYSACHQPRKDVASERSRLGPCKEKLLSGPAQQLELSLKGADRDMMTEERCREEEEEDTCGRTAEAGGGDRLDEELEADGRGPSPVQQQLHMSAAAEQQRTRSALMLRDHRGGKRTTSLEVSAAAHDGASDVQSCRISPGSARRKGRSRSIPTELTAPSSSPYAERPAGCADSRETGAAKKFDVMDSKQRRASDGVLCVVKETEKTPPRGRLSPSLPYKLEPVHPVAFVNEEIGYGAKEKHRTSKNGFSSNGETVKDSGRPRVPVVCLERLKVLVSQLPPHGRRQSDPLPSSERDKTEPVPQQRTWHFGTSEGITRGSGTRRTTRSLTAPSYSQTHIQSSMSSNSSDFDSHNNRRQLSSQKASVLLPTDAHCVPQHYPVLDLDSDSDPRSVSEDPFVSIDPDPRQNSDASPDSDPNAQSSSEAEFIFVAERKPAAAAERRLCGDSEPSLEYEADPDSDEGQELDADAELGDAETESDTQPDYDPIFQAETDSDAVSGQPQDSQASLESELDLESELELAADDPQPLRSDLEEESPVGPAQRPLLIANPGAQRVAEEAQTERDVDEMESEDFCAVCLIGGELLCCDRCPKVFHLSCHVPPLLSFPTGDWVCSLCRDVVQPEVEYSCENERTPGVHTHGLSACDQRKCERLTLLILSNMLSAPFHEPVSPLARHYYQIIKRPMDLSVIRAKLNKGNSKHYSSADQFVTDVYLMFRNCAKFNYPDSEVAQAGRSLEVFFTSKLGEVFPDRVFPAAEVDSDSDENDAACWAAESGFPWPERREQSHRKRKRRQSIKSRRHHF